MADVKVLEGKTALVTGASSGMGKATARLLAEDGATVMIMGRREDRIRRAAEELRTQAPDARIEAFTGDAGDEASARAALEAAHGLDGRLDMIVSAVGKGVYKPMLLCDATDMLDEYRAEVLTAFFMIRYGAPLMPAGGSIVCVSSTAGTLPCAGLAPYAAAKAALEMFVKVSALELGQAQIRVNAVRPGFTRGEGTASMFEDADILRSFTDFIPMGRGGESDDLARALRFLAGPESGWVTGQVFAADGGQELRGFPDPGGLLDMIYGKEVMEQVRAAKLPG
jgi:NAD(P)-dependent dehydrogenase (short-subunit alcohol dehydrogenase family)